MRVLDWQCSIQEGYLKYFEINNTACYKEVILYNSNA